MPHLPPLTVILGLFAGALAGCSPKPAAQPYEAQPYDPGSFLDDAQAMNPETCPPQRPALSEADQLPDWCFTTTARDPAGDRGACLATMDRIVDHLRWNDRTRHSPAGTVTLGQ